RELLMRFLPSYEGRQGEEASGVILHIEESPYDLAEALNFAEVRSKEDPWMVTPVDIKVVDALRKNPQFSAFVARARAVCQALEKAEDIEALRAAQMKPGADNRLAAAMPVGNLVGDAWHDRAHFNACLPTTLSKVGRPAAAGLIIHSFALAMAKLHILCGF